MARVYRSMFPDSNDNKKPAIGPKATALGVRVPPAKMPDVTPDENGLVHPNFGGMSVVSDWRELAPHRIPSRLKTKAADTCGKDDLRCWCMGEGEFVEEPITVKLLFRPNSDPIPTHGLIEPSQTMSIDAYQAALAETQDDWIIDES